MFSNSNLLKFNSNFKFKEPYKEINKKSKESKESKESNVYIEKSNKLFWCLYIFIYGKDNYNYLNNSYKVEQDFKFKTIEKIRENKDLLKFHKIKRLEIEDNLMNSDKLSLKSLNCLALIYKLNIIYIKNRVYYKFNYNLDIEMINCKNIIEEKDNEIKIINISVDILQNIFDNYYNVININKPINAISYYKLADLIEISKKLNIEITQKNKLKLELYNEIINFF